VHGGNGKKNAAVREESRERASNFPRHQQWRNGTRKNGKMWDKKKKSGQRGKGEIKIGKWDRNTRASHWDEGEMGGGEGKA